MQNPHPSLWKQVTGALIGAAIALGAYEAYSLGSPLVQAALGPDVQEAESMPAMSGTSSSLHTSSVSSVQRRNPPVQRIVEGVSEPLKRSSVVKDSRLARQELSLSSNSYSSYAPSVTQSATHAAAPAPEALPNSGVGMQTGVILTFLLACALAVRRKYRMR